VSPTAQKESAGNTGLRVFTLRERFLLWLISWSAYLLLRLIGSTLRFKFKREGEEILDAAPEAYPGIYCFWHRTMIPAAYRFRNRQFAIMISQSFDGECIARIVEKLGFRPVRGSSSRGGATALLEMREELNRGHLAVFTADGPRGPLYVAKPGAVLLAQNTGHKIYSFHVTVERAWILKSWDRMMIPKPFSRASLFLTAPFAVPSNLNEGQIEEWRNRLQGDLDRARVSAEEMLVRH